MTNPKTTTPRKKKLSAKNKAPCFQWSFLHPRYWLLWLSFAIGWLIAQLPFTLQMNLGVLIGKLLQKTSSRRAHIAKTNLALCFPKKTDQQRDHILNKNFESTGIAIMETIMSWWTPNSKLKKRITIEGLEYLDKAMKQNKGVILLGSHFTTLEIAGKLLTNYANFYALYRKHKNPVFDYVMYKGRSRYCEATIERGNMREMLRGLKSGKAIWYAPDQNYGAEHSVFVNFFNIPAATITATSRLASMNNSPVIPFSHQRSADNKSYTLRLQPPLENFPSDDVVNDTQRINNILEKEIEKMPEQYLWSHRRFKTRPDNLPPVY